MFDWFHLIFVSISVRFLRLFTVRRCVHPLVCLCRRNGGLNTKSPDEAPRSKILHRFGSGVDFRFPLFACVTALKGERLIATYSVKLTEYKKRMGGSQEA